MTDRPDDFTTPPAMEVERESHDAERSSEPRPPVTFASINRDMMRMISTPGPVWWAAFIFDLAVLLTGGICLRNQIVLGLGVAGYTRPVMWAAYITNFVFWVGIAHCGTLVSAILFLFRSHFRRAVYRVAEAMTVFGVLTAGLFPILHTGRPWFAYWLVPYPNQRQLWPNFRSPLEWDVFAVSTYLTLSSIFFLVGLIPDIAVARDQVKNKILKATYTVLSFGWTGGNTQWKHFYGAYLYFAALCTPLVLSVHSVVSWDFAMAQVPGWHSTIFAPYFVAGAIFSGVALVINLLVVIRKAFRLEHVITLDHMEKLGKLVLLTSTIVGYSYLCEIFIAWYGPSSYERETFFYRYFGHFWWATWIMITCNVFLPLLMWFKQVRRNMAVMFVLCLFVNVGMWFERFVIIVTSLARPFEPYSWAVNYKMSWTEFAITMGAFAWFFMFFLIFVRTLPAISVAEIKETLPAPFRRRRRA
ncbi:MAG TPA: NrfD/PsrC family molybdoenzyme membrane anchor subunit [Candidatus Eisenbacteria bacterium]|nr:NrfD/PsrC family molybdoenzyme membrane anchor subunit [Candidatus Eisenbacteria bacterium]